MTFASLSLIVAQACAGFLPPASHEIEWFRNGEPYARDVPTDSAPNAITYRRTFSAGNRSVTRVLSCVRETELVERIGDAEVRIPVSLGNGRSVTRGEAIIRRVTAPQRSTPGALWFSVAHGDTRLYALRRRLGVEQVRTPAPGGVDVLHAVARAPAIVPVEADPATARQMTELVDAERDLRILRDSIAGLARAHDARLARVEREYLAALANERAAKVSLSSSLGRVLADSALRLPSEERVRQAGYLWPGAGHHALGSGGAVWRLGGVIAMGAIAAAVLLPTETVESAGVEADIGRPALGFAGALTYATLLAWSRHNLNGILRAERDAYRTRESFLQNAYVEVSPAGAVVIRFRTQTR